MKYHQAGFPPYFSQNFFQSHWQVTQRCNFSCPYCVNESLRKDGIHMSPAIMRRALQLLAALPRPVQRFSLSGGEVTLYPHLEEMLTGIAALFPSDTVVNMLTNGSASVRRMREILACAAKLQCRFIITTHLGQIRLPELIGKLQEFSPRERKKYFHIKLIAPPSTHTQDIREEKARSQLDAAGIDNYAVHAVVDFTNGKLAAGYTAEDFVRLAPPHGRKEYFHFMHRTGKETQTVTFLEGLRRDMFHYTGMVCSAGHQSIYLDEYGHVSKGQFCGRMPYTILERNPFEDPDFFAPGRCAEPHCTCIPYTGLPKWRDGAHAPEWLKDGA